MKSNDLSKIDQWLEGTSDNLPQDIKLAVKDLITKLQFSQGALIVNQLKRSMKLLQTINILEAELTDPKYLLTLEPEAKYEILQYCTNNLNKTMDMINKFMLANKDSLNYMDKKTTQLQNLLLSLSNEEIDEILTLLEDSKND